MTGFAGIIDQRLALKSDALVSTMVQSMAREQSSSSGTHRTPQLGLSIGWFCSLAAPSNCIPNWNERRDLCLMFCGEDYRDQSEIDRLRSIGHEFDSEDGSYLVHLYEERGPAFFEELNGSFSGLVIDLRLQKLVLFNDRYGLNRVYFHQSENAFYFASEAKALLKIFPHLRSIDLRSLGEFFSCGCVLQNRTLFSGISLMPPASAWVFLPGQPVKKEFYFSAEKWEQQPAMSAEDYYQSMKAAWNRVLPRYFRGKEASALSLTGGVDSRMILASAPSAAGKLPCFTFQGKFRECTDVKVARQVARVCGQPFHVIRINQEFLHEFPSLAQRAVYLSDGAMDVTGSVDLFVQPPAREIAPVRITGTNGGEMLRRIVAFRPGTVYQSLFESGLFKSITEAALTYSNEK